MFMPASPAPNGASLPAEGNVKAFAKIVGSGGIRCYLKALEVTLGRQQTRVGDPKQVPDIPLGSSKIVSRIHAKISYNPQIGCFEFRCLSKNGAFVNGVFVRENFAPVPLMSRTLIQIGDKMLFFLLPNSGTKNEEILAPLSQGLFVQDEERKGHGNPAGIEVSSKLEVVHAFKKWSRGGKQRFKKAFLTWGFGNWEKIWKDTNEPEWTIEELQVFGLCMLKEIQDLIQNDPECEEAFTDAFREMIDTIRMSGYFPSSVPDDEIRSWSTFQKNAKKVGRILVQLFFLKQSVDKYGLIHMLDGIEPVPIRSLPAVWSHQHDLHLLIGIFRHGWGNYKEIIQDPDLCFNGEFKEETDTQSLALETWPNHHTTGARIKKLIDAMHARDTNPDAFSSSIIEPQSKRVKKEFGTTTNLGTDAPSNSDPSQTKKKKQVKRKSAWTKKQELQFQKAMLTQGRPQSWEQFRESFPALADKSDESLQQVFDLYIQSLNSVLGTHYEFSPLCDVSGLSSESKELLTPVDLKKRTAATFKDRLDLIALLEEAVNAPQFETIVASAPVLKELPVWWNKECDVSLIRGTLLHGFSNYEKLTTDPNLEFAKLDVKIADFPENKIILKRIRMLGNLIVKKSALSKGVVHDQKSTSSKESIEESISVLNLSPELKILSVGSIVDQEGFRKGNIIYPAGFVSQRTFSSLTSKSHVVQLEIQDQGDNLPLFRFTIDGSDVTRVESNESIDKPWQVIKECLDESVQNITASAENLFGLDNEMLHEALESMHPEKADADLFSEDLDQEEDMEVDQLQDEQSDEDLDDEEDQEDRDNIESDRD